MLGAGLVVVVVLPEVLGVFDVLDEPGVVDDAPSCAPAVLAALGAAHPAAVARAATRRRGRDERERFTISIDATDQVAQFLVAVARVAIALASAS